jgi:hypothetical protein
VLLLSCALNASSASLQIRALLQVRMKAKNVIQRIVPWADARLTLATKLRRKLAEDAVRAHIASADPSIERTRALELLQQWYWRSSTLEDGSWDPQDERRCCADKANGHTGDGGSTEDVNCPAGARDDGHQAMVERDEKFLIWLHSAEGAAKIGAELKKLKRSAAASAFLEMARSEEGREGLLMSLREMVKKNSSFKAQLASVLES